MHDTARRRLLMTSLAAAPTLLTLTPARARAASSLFKPGVPIKITVPYPAGGGTDVMARAIAPGIAQAAGVQAIVENRPGAGSTLATGAVARDKPDGHSILVTTTAILQAPSVLANVTFDPIKDFIPVAIPARVPLVFAVPGDSPAKSMKDYVRMAKERPNDFGMGNYGTGTLSHIFGAMLRSQAQLQVSDATYKGGAPLAADIAGGHISGGFTDLTSLPMVKSGRVRYLAATGPTRLKPLPDVPTMTELGYVDYEIFGFAGVFVPAGTPAAVVDALATAIQATTQTDDFRAKLDTLAFEPGGMSQQEFAQLCARDVLTWQRLIKSAGIQPS